MPIDKEKLEKELKKVIYQYLVNECGFLEDEVEEYSSVKIFKDQSDYSDDDFVKVEVRAELSTEELMGLAERLTEIIEDYDDEAYFDLEYPGLTSAYLFNSTLLNETLTEDIKFNGTEFERNIPNEMRFKEYQIETDYDGTEVLYWITQQFFDEIDVSYFMNALEDTRFTRAYITTRDISTYNFKKDVDSEVGVWIDLDQTPSIIDYENYRYAMSIDEDIDNYIVEKRMASWDDDELEIELDDIEEFVENNSLEKLTARSWTEMLEDFPNFCIWFDKFHRGIWGTGGELDDNSTTIEEEWEYMDEPEYLAVMDFARHKGTSGNPTSLIIKYDDGLSRIIHEEAMPNKELNTLKDKIKEFICNIIINEVEDNLAREVAHKYKDYNIDWCLEDTGKKEHYMAEQALDNYADSLIDVLFAEYK